MSSTKKSAYAHEQKMHVHRHNGLCGRIISIRRQLNILSRCSSLTNNARDQILEALTHIQAAEHDVWCNRKELDGSVTLVKHKSKPDQDV